MRQEVIRGKLLGIHLAPDRGAQDAFCGAVEFVPFVVGEIGRRAARMPAALEENLVGIDVADAGEDGLVHESGLERAPPVPEPSHEGVAIRFQGIGAEIVPGEMCPSLRGHT